MKLLIALPCYNEAEKIAQVLASIPETFAGIDERRLLVVDDGSADDTARLALAAGAMVVRHKCNRGLGQAFRTAVDYAVEHGFDVMVNMDGDGQFDPGEIQNLIDPILREETDFVTGSRFMRGRKIEHMPAVKRWGNRQMNHLVSRFCGQTFSDVSCGFRAYNRETLLKINFYGRFTYTQESFVSFKFQNLAMAEVPISVRYFPDRKSRVAGSVWTYFKRTLKILSGLLRDYYPMKFFGLLGGCFLVPTAIFGMMFLIHYLKVGYFSGYLFAGLIAAFCLLIAVLMFSFGVAMESMVRINRNENRILYQQRKIAPVTPEGELRILLQ
ncbi:MAG TPA: glycosyltransferase family 2 protein [Candidatus Limiplasma sp.]|jgi:glycosyltransferase involved in cell wall biosynthesis|nr:glycosyltransferase family 2 protein [Candidatus Limiplasma sp.]